MVSPSEDTNNNSSGVSNNNLLALENETNCVDKTLTKDDSDVRAVDNANDAKINDTEDESSRLDEGTQ